LNLAVDRFFCSNRKQLFFRATSWWGNPDGGKSDKEALKKIRHLGILFERDYDLSPVLKGLYSSLAQFTELVEVNYVVRLIELKEENWNEE